jgi:hypothetical protein
VTWTIKRDERQQAMAAGPGRTGDDVKSSGEAATDEKRRCAVCGEKLSAYNDGPTCFAHTVGLPWRGPNNRP